MFEGFPDEMFVVSPMGCLKDSPMEWGQEIVLWPCKIEIRRIILWMIRLVCVCSSQSEKKDRRTILASES